MNKINVYACGGTGTNIGARLAEFHEKEYPGFATLNINFIDTSRSNLSPDISDERVYIYKDRAGDRLDGNGKKRSSNIDVLSEISTIKQILHKFPPGNMNIVIHSGGGGTGSVAGPLIARELISRGELVVVLMIGSTASGRDVFNTLDTLKTYENLASRLNNPINILYRENSQSLSRADNDQEMENYVYLLAAFFSGQNHGLDTADVRNFLNFNNVTSYPPRLTAFDLFSGQVRLPDNGMAITSLSLANENAEINLGVMVDYQVTGVANPNITERIQSKLPAHAVTFSGFFGPVVARLEKLAAEHEAREALMSSRQIISANDKSTEDGLILR